MNEFSIVCRILGTLFYRQPQDPVLAPVLTLIKEGKLQQHWPLDQESLLERLEKGVDLTAMAADYQALFIGDNCAVPPWRSAYETDDEQSDVRSFLQARGMPLNVGAVDHFGALLLAASWLEDHSQEDETAAQIALFDDYLLPWSHRFLGKVESHAVTPFYRTLAVVCREALDAMRDELEEDVNNTADNNEE
ncbi:TorD/DmsD family molecular chaperone [Brenneria izbisi]|uniref:Molecular chaperone n=1 Tax=Brenneria izbisi TaxID=2939450 RepID=A0AA41Y0V4_9GAMM|nr:molecular chaperone [Brenneria izbisi]MCV9880337.1 molecular chaperone [Brenneria izbisi]MCV9883723.1 molecular chaperone [Brenneria izbisi]